MVMMTPMMTTMKMRGWMTQYSVPGWVSNRDDDPDDDGDDNDDEKLDDLVFRAWEGWQR